MNKKIKIITLLNKIANGEEVPKSIKYVDNILKYDESIQEYIGLPITGAGAFFNYLFVNKPTLSFINEEVEILEDNTEEIEKLPDDIDEFGWLEVKDKINELVKAVKN